MPGYRGMKRKTPFGPNKQGFRTKIRRKMSGPSMRPFKMHGRTKFGDSLCTVGLKDIKSFQLTSGSDLNEQITGSGVLTAPLFKRYANLYGRFRIKAVKVEFMKDVHMSQLLTAVTQLSEEKPVDDQAYLRDITCRFHNLQYNSRYTPSRSMRTSDIPLFNTFLPTSSNASQMPDCAVNFLLKHQHLSSLMTLEVKVTYVVEFAYMLKGTSLDNQTPV
jgi:hypothetical protein